MLLPHGAVIAVADGAKLELFRNAGTATAPSLTALPTPELTSQNRSAGVRRDSTVINPEHQLEEDAHAAAVAEWLNHEVLTHRIEKLVVIAPPRTLGELRRHYHKELTAALIGELPRELIGRGPQAVVEALRGK
ncbi:MAG: host attachment protein [Phenylobacterium sp.]|jgi:protein required for attachment to host cells|uniref:host attachment family protein n=1 Tax=Phenylobacterium sp. TaxID=1871053 RepID=UPI002A35BF85|nr:host attachment protein [Phenylobacterium sp.]MDX9997175.1 host attachment protein [Phenylobacterium sp.]